MEEALLVSGKSTAYVRRGVESGESTALWKDQS